MIIAFGNEHPKIRKYVANIMIIVCGNIHVWNFSSHRAVRKCSKIWFECKQICRTVSRKTWVSFEMKMVRLLLLLPAWVFSDPPNIILINMDDMG